MIRVLTINRPPYEHFHAHIGGDDIQRQMLAKYMPSDIKIIHNWDLVAIGESWEAVEFDIVHAYNLVLNETVQALEIAKSRGVPLVVQSIFPPGIYCSGIDNVRKVVSESTRLFSNLKNDAVLMADELNLDLLMVGKKSRWIPTGAPADWYLADATIEVPPRPYAILAARFEDRKAQDKFLQEMINQGVDIPIYLVGDTRHPVYARCEELTKDHPWIHLVGPQPHANMKSWFANAAVSILPTHYDNPGLVNLEAGIIGCHIVTSDLLAIREYLKGYPWYGEVGYPETHVNQLDILWSALEDQDFVRDVELAQYVLDNFTWERAAQMVHDEYVAIMNER